MNIQGQNSKEANLFKLSENSPGSPWTNSPAELYRFHAGVQAGSGDTKSGVLFHWHPQGVRQSQTVPQLEPLPPWSARGAVLISFILGEIAYLQQGSGVSTQTPT